MSLLAHTALLAQQAFGPLEGVGTALAGWAVDDPDRHCPKPPVVDGDTLRLFGDTRVYLVADHTQSEWSDHEYIHMLHDGREMSFTLDLSRVPCGCIATAAGLAVAALLLAARRHLRERSARRANADAVADAEGGARHSPRRTGRGERQEKELLVMPAAAATDL